MDAEDDEKETDKSTQDLMDMLVRFWTTWYELLSHISYQKVVLSFLFSGNSTMEAVHRSVHMPFSLTGTNARLNSIFL